MATKFLYMDEQYIDFQTYKTPVAPGRREAVCLVGVLIPAGVHAQFRREFYAAVKATMAFEENVIPPVPIVHASQLFPGVDDEVKFRFLETIVDLAKKFGFRVYRVGYFKTRETLKIFNGKNNLLGVSFLGILTLLKSELEQHEIWPVMETNNTPVQDDLFAGQIQRIDYYTSVLGAASMSIDNTNLGELHYVTKKSAYGSVTDCISYLLDAMDSGIIGKTSSTFKRRLAQIGEGLQEIIDFNEIIEMQITDPPAQ